MPKWHPSNSEREHRKVLENTKKTSYILHSTVKSVQSALTHLLTTSGPRSTISHLSANRGCISIIELLQFTIVRFLWAALGKACFRKRAIEMRLSEQRVVIALGQKKFRGDAVGRSKLIEQTL